jgi:arylsulfatase A-like enzyme
MSGRSLFRIKEDLAGQATWPEQFGKSGYKTFITGKWHNEAESLLRSFSEGKAVFLGGMGNPYKLRLADISDDHRLFNWRISGEHSVKLFADAAVDFIIRQNGDQPWLLYFAPNCPHDPRIAPHSYHVYYNKNQPPLPANFLPFHPFNNGEMAVRDEMLAPWPRTPEVVRQNLADYYSYITFMDDEIGRIFAALRATSQYDNTIIVFSSDNGLALGSHGLFGKQNLYDHATHEPLIFAGPGIPTGQRRDALCYLFDIFPTLGELAGVAAPAGNEGVSLLPAIQGAPQAGREAIFTAYRSFQRAVRDDRWKLIVYPQINKRQLFDLRNDPYETNDLAGDPGQTAELARLTALLESSQRKFNDHQALSTNNPCPLSFDFSRVKIPKHVTSID